MLLKYVGRRMLQSVFVLFLVSILAFMLIRMAPGSPARMMLSEFATEEEVAAMAEELGLNQPLPVQYYKYISGVLQGNFGMSTTYKVPVADLIPSKLKTTAILSFYTVICGLLLSIPLGIIAGSHRGTATDFFAMFFALLGQSMSPVWLGIFNIYVFSVWLGILPSIGVGGFQHLILPTITLGYPMAAALTRVARSGMIDTLGEDYITSTLAKGISRFEVNWKYAFKNALIPVITLTGLQIAQFLAGTMVVETIYSYSGIGQLMYQSVSTRDYAAVQSLLLVSAACLVVINLVVDIINSLVDPRIRLE